MHTFIQRLAVAFSIIALAAALVSCGGGGSADSSQTEGTGTVGILLTDKPADPAMFAAIIASIVKVELMGSEENGPVTLYEGEAKEFDLLRLRNESIPLAFKDKVPVGTYCKIRLILDDLTLFLADDTPETLDDNDTENPKLPGNGKLDLVARDCFDVVDKEVLTLQLDMDAGKSIHIIEKGSCLSNPAKSCFNFRPVVFVDVIDKDFESKLVRLSGYITEIYPESTLLEPPLIESLLLCDAVPSKDMDNEGCVKVHFGKDSAFFDNAPFSDDGNDSNDGNDGNPTPIYKLRNYMGEKLTVVGWAKSWASKDNDDDKPEAYYPLMYLEALAAELGGFLQVEGTVAVDADSKGFPMNVSSGGPVITDSTLAVIYQPGDTDINGDWFNGTRIVSKSGVLLDPLDVKAPLPVQVDGTLQLMADSDPLLKAALVIVDKGALDAEYVTGVIQTLETSSLTLKLEDPDTICGFDTDPIPVDLINPLEILTVIITIDSYEFEPGGTLQVGQTVFMDGSCGSSSYQTDNAIIIIDKRPKEE